MNSDSAHKSLEVLGNIWLVGGILLALASVGFGIAQFASARDWRGDVDSAAVIAGFTFLAYAVAAVAGGWFTKALTSCLVDTNRTVAALRDQVGRLSASAVPGSGAQESLAVTSSQLTSEAPQMSQRKQTYANGQVVYRCGRCDTVYPVAQPIGSRCGACGLQFTNVPG